MDDKEDKHAKQKEAMKAMRDPSKEVWERYGFSKELWDRLGSEWQKNFLEKQKMADEMYEKLCKQSIEIHRQNKKD